MSRDKNPASHVHRTAKYFGANKEACVGHNHVFTNLKGTKDGDMFFFPTPALDFCIKMFWYWYFDQQNVSIMPITKENRTTETLAENRTL